MLFILAGAVLAEMPTAHLKLGECVIENVPGSYLLNSTCATQREQALQAQIESLQAQMRMAPPPAPHAPMLPPVMELCARIKNDDGTNAHGNTYLTSAWGSIQGTSSFGNECGLVVGPTHFAFRVYSSSGGAELFRTQNISIAGSGGSASRNPFQLASSNFYVRYGDATSGYFAIDYEHSGHGGDPISGNSCESHQSGNDQQRTAFCVGNGAAFQSVLGGINGDSYGNNHGPCMCNPGSMCGSCTSTAVIEIYAVAPPPPVVELCARIKNDDGTNAHGNTYLTSAWGALVGGRSTAFGNQCPYVVGATHYAFRVYASSDGTLLFATGYISLGDKRSPFQPTSSNFYVRYGDATSGYFAIDFNKRGHGGDPISGNSCESHQSGNDQQRTAFCVGNGATFQSILGGINGDNYGNNHGPCMCNPGSMCGSCTSTAVIEIYAVTPHLPPP